jgi:hypothetical protein
MSLEISNIELDRDEWQPDLLERVSTLLTNLLQQSRSWETDSLSLVKKPPIFHGT